MRVLIAEDEHDGRYLLTVALGASGFEVEAVPDGAQALEAGRRHPPDVLVTDVLMPHMDGYQLCRAWKNDPALAQVPVVFYSAAYTEPADQDLASTLGADRFLLKPMDPLQLAQELRDVIGEYQSGRRRSAVEGPGQDYAVLQLYNERLVNQLEQKVAELQAANERLEATTGELRTSVRRLSALTDGIVSALAKIVESRDPYTAGHQARVAKLAHALAVRLEMDAEICDSVRLAALLHDLGKLHIPAEILSKPGRLTDVEFAIIKTHARAGRDVLSSIEFPRPVAEFVGAHHERMDGSGYPDGLAGDEILLEARVLAVADVVEAMTTHRPYRPALGIDAALAEVETGAGRIYDDSVVRACVSLFRDNGFSFE